MNGLKIEGESDELAVEPEEYEPLGFMDMDEELSIIERSEADFLHWSQRAYWTLEQGIALLLSKDPYEVYWKRIRSYVNFHYSIPLCQDYGKLRMVVVQARAINEISNKMSPTAFLEWAERKCIAIPEKLKQQVEKINANMKNGVVLPCQTAFELMKKKLVESAMLLAAKETEIYTLQKERDILQKRLKKLRRSQRVDFNTVAPTYSRELDIAVKAHAHVSKNLKEGKSVKQQILAWLNTNYPEEAKEATGLPKRTREYIARICNWQKEGGAPSTPKRLEQKLKSLDT